MIQAKVSVAQKRKAFINSLNTVIGYSFEVPFFFRKKLAKNLLYLQFLSILRSVVIPFAGLSFSNAPFYVSSYITSR